MNRIVKTGFQDISDFLNNWKGPYRMDENLVGIYQGEVVYFSEYFPPEGCHYIMSGAVVKAYQLLKRESFPTDFFRLEFVEDRIIFPAFDKYDDDRKLKAAEEIQRILGCRTRTSGESFQIEITFWPEEPSSGFMLKNLEVNRLKKIMKWAERNEITIELTYDEKWFFEKHKHFRPTPKWYNTILPGTSLIYCKIEGEVPDHFFHPECIVKLDVDESTSSVFEKFDCTNEEQYAWWCRKILTDRMKSSIGYSREFNEDFDGCQACGENPCMCSHPAGLD